MKMAKRGIALAIGALVLIALASASSWEGSAMTGTVGDFPSSGYYAACNSFARNTTIEVTNLENGRSVTVIVTRGLESSGVFMMLSAEAATTLGIQSGRLARIRATEPRSAIELAPATKGGSSFDPDMNPRLLAAEELKRLGYELEPQAPAVVSAAPQSAAPQSAAPQPAAPQPAAPQPVAVVVAPKPIEAPAAATTKPAETPKPAPIGRDVPPAPSVASAPVLPVAEPAPRGAERPESVASIKPRPVRTIVLPQLPEPSTPGPAVAAAAGSATMTATTPEVVGQVLPVPDETPIRVAASSIPRKYEPPAVMPEVASRGPRAPAGAALSMALIDPEPVSNASASAQALAYSRPVPDMSGNGATASLADPAIPTSEHADAYSRVAPSLMSSDTGTELAWPELEADEMPEIVLSHLAEPIPSIPQTSLAEGELVLPDNQGPAAVALETPVYGAAETAVELADAEAAPEEVPQVVTSPGLNPGGGTSAVGLAEAEAKGQEKPVAVSPGPAMPVDSAGSTKLADAVEHKPETAPIAGQPAPQPAPAVALETPRDYVVTIEPTIPKPPVAPVAPKSPVSPAAAQAVAPSGTVIVTSPLEKGRYYIQIGAYASEAAARDAATLLGKKFAILVQKINEKGKDTWRVFVGPLSRDESGVALVKVRSMGFKDAFVKSGS